MTLKYHELWSSDFDPDSGSAWEEVDLTSRNVPNNCVAEILIDYDGDSEDYEASAGVRELGSSLERRYRIQPQYSADNMLTMLVNVDSDGKIEIYDNHDIAHVSTCKFKVIGYFTGATYTETHIILDTDSTPPGWKTDDLYTDHSIPKGSVIEVLMGVDDNDSHLQVGLREYGQTGRQYYLNDGSYPLGARWIRVFETTDSTDGKIDTYVEGGDGRLRCIGYWDQTVSHVVKKQELSASSPASWEDKNLNGYSVPTDSIGNFVCINKDTNDVEIGGAREDGSSWSRIKQIDIATLDTNTYVGAYSLCARILGASSTVEIYSGDTSDCTIILDGYLVGSSGIAKINGIAIDDIAKINGIDIGDAEEINGILN